MIKVPILTFIFFVSNICVYAIYNPGIKFTKTTIDYGKINKGGNGIKIFEFKNNGTSPLKINEVYSSCGCTIPKKPQNPIMPGDFGEIVVKYDTNRLGLINKTITVKTNSKKNPVIFLKIKGEVKQ
tara:strand:- start:82859 stop:83236 length:378 start_codon:yes stop_codon:yes gene_type:complete